MDFTSKGIGWVENIYQKIETVCVDVCQEMDNYIAQEHSRFVKKRMESVGINVQSFYNEVLQDLLQPVDTLKGPLSDLSLIYGFDGVKELADQDSPQSDEIPDTDLDTALPRNVSGLESVYDASTDENVVENTCNSMNENLTSGPPDNICPKGEEGFGKLFSVERTSVGESAVSLSSDSDYAFVSEPLGSHLSLSAGDLSSVSTAGTSLSGARTSRVESVSALTSSGTSSNIYSEQFVRENLCDSVKEKIEDFEDVTLFESYLSARQEELDDDISIVCHQEARMPKSFKKKLRDVIISRLRSTYKNDYRRLGIIYDNSEKRNDEGGSMMSGGKKESEVPSNLKHCESDWELL